MGEIPLAGGANAVLETDLVVPSEHVQAGHVKQFSRRSIRLRRIEHNRGVRIHHRLHESDEIANREILARPGVDVERIVVAAVDR